MMQLRVRTSDMRAHLVHMLEHGQNVVNDSGEVAFPIDGTTVRIPYWEAGRLFTNGITTLTQEPDGTWYASPDESPILEWESMVSAIEQANIPQQENMEVENS